MPRCLVTRRYSLVIGAHAFQPRRLCLIDWGLPKCLLSDRDPKFLSELWSELFALLGVQLLYSTAYHPETDGQSERTNATVEIALRYYLGTLEQVDRWPTVLPRLQSTLNSSRASHGKTPNVAVYCFTPNTATDLLTSKDVDPAKDRIEITDAIAMAQMSMKHHYDRKHHAVFFSSGRLGPATPAQGILHTISEVKEARITVRRAIM